MWPDLVEVLYCNLDLNIPAIIKSMIGSADVNIYASDFEKFLEVPLCSKKLARKSKVFLYSC